MWYIKRSPIVSCPVKELNQPHKFILTTVSVTQHFNHRIFKLLQDFHDPFMPVLHNGFIHLSKPRAGSTCPNITPFTTPTLIELVTLSRNGISLTIVVLTTLYGNLFTHAFVSPTAFLAGCLTHLRRGCEGGCRIIFKAYKASKEIPGEKRAVIRKFLMRFFL